MAFPTDLPLWPFRPNWRMPVRITYEFKTEIFVADDPTHEQRRALRQTPRRSLEFLATGFPGLYQKAVFFLQRYLGQEIAIGDFSRGTYTTLPAVIGAQTLHVANTPFWIDEDEAVVVQSKDFTALYTVASVVGTEITFDEVFANPWTEDTKVYPAMRGRIKPEQRGQAITAGVGEFRMLFEETPGYCPAWLFTHSGTKLNLREVFDIDPNWAAPVQNVYNWPVERVDFGQGRVGFLERSDFGRTVRSAVFAGWSLDRLDALVGAFWRAKGRRGELYVPTWTADLELKAPASSGDTLLRFDGLDNYLANVDNLTFRAIAIFMADGRKFYRKVSAVEEESDSLGADTRLVLTAGLPYDIAPGTVAMVCWLQCCRFATDTLVLDLQAQEVAANVQLSFQTLRDLAVEVDEPE